MVKYIKYEAAKPDTIVITEKDLDPVPNVQQNGASNILAWERFKHLLYAILIGGLIFSAYGALVVGPDSGGFFYAIAVIIGYGFWTSYRSRFARYSQGFLTKLSGTSSGCINMVFALAVIGIMAPFIDLIHHLIKFMFYKDGDSDENSAG
jgi:hypothetical protein